MTFGNPNLSLAEQNTNGQPEKFDYNNPEHANVMHGAAFGMVNEQGRNFIRGINNTNTETTQDSMSSPSFNLTTDQREQIINSYGTITPTAMYDTPVTAGTNPTVQPLVQSSTTQVIDNTANTTTPVQEQNDNDLLTSLFGVSNNSQTDINSSVQPTATTPIVTQPVVQPTVQPIVQPVIQPTTAQPTVQQSGQGTTQAQLPREYLDMVQNQNSFQKEIAGKSLDLGYNPNDTLKAIDNIPVDVLVKFAMQYSQQQPQAQLQGQQPVNTGQQPTHIQQGAAQSFPSIMNSGSSLESIRAAYNKAQEQKNNPMGYDPYGGDELY